MNIYQHKYQKYRQKYMTFRHQSGGAVNNSDIQQLITTLEQLQDNRV